MDVDREDGGDSEREGKRKRILWREIRYKQNKTILRNVIKWQRHIVKNDLRKGSSPPAGHSRVEGPNCKVLVLLTKIYQDLRLNS